MIGRLVGIKHSQCSACLASGRSQLMAKPLGRQLERAGVLLTWDHE